MNYLQFYYNTPWLKPKLKGLPGGHRYDDRLSAAEHALFYRGRLAKWLSKYRDMKDQDNPTGRAVLRLMDQLCDKIEYFDYESGIRTIEFEFTTAIPVALRSKG